MKVLEVINTPGYYYSIAYWLAALIVVCTNKDRFETKKKFFIQGVCLVVLLIFMTLTDGVRQWLFIPCMLVVIVILLISIYTCCEFTLSEAGYYCARVFISGEFAASLAWQMYYYAVRHLKVRTNKFIEWSFLLIVYGIIFGFLYFKERTLQKDFQELYIGKRELITVIIIVSAVFAVSNMSYLSKSGPFSSTFPTEMFIIRTLVDLSGMAVLYAYHMQMRELQMRFEVDTLQNILQMQYKNYQLSQESIEIVNQKYHDLKHQIALLKAEADGSKAMAYLDKMEKEIKIYEAQNKTGNKVLDAVLTSKTLYCHNKNISLTCVADGLALSFMEDMDISALFGNLLDNAVESVERLKEEEKRLIHLSVATQKRFLRIRVENYCEEKLAFKNGLPVTTKKEIQFHGYGLKSIQNTAKKYGGSVAVDLQKNWFEVRILIPIPRD